MENYCFSKYNLFVKRKDLVVGLNLFNQNLFCIDISRYEQLLSYKDQLEVLEDDDPIFFSTMYKLGIIEDSDLDIPGILLLKNREEVFSNEIFDLTINLTLKCNFTCWYCFETHPNITMNKNIQDSVVKFVARLIQERRITKLRVNWFGGEPMLTINSAFKNLAGRINDLCEKSNVTLIGTLTTNGSLLNNESISFFKEHNIKSFQITLDGNKELHNKVRYNKKETNSYDTIVANICKLVREIPSISLYLRINYKREYLTRSVDIIDSFPVELRDKIIVSLTNIIQEKDYKIESQIKEYNVSRIFKEAGFKIFRRSNISTLYHTCYAELYNQAIINSNGHIFKCSTCDFANEEGEGTLSENGEIIWNENALAKRISKATFDNKKCLRCIYLPICRGGCSQHKIYNSGENSSCLIKHQYEKILKDLMLEFSKTDRKILSLKSMEQIMIN
jgi:uncharacterized protein